MMVSTTNDVTGFKIVRHLGIVRGITVRSRSVVGNFVGGLQSMFGGQIGAYVELAETAGILRSHVRACHPSRRKCDRWDAL
jgi:uncharacterized protein YbjQ (UPF0145 family)